MTPLLIFAFFASLLWLVSLHQVITKKLPFGTTPYLFPMGIYVWGDGIIIGLFWTLFYLICWLFLDWTWFGLGTSIFWAIRSGGEVLYWLLEQFATHHRNTPSSLVGHKVIKNDAIYFVYQLTNQCICVAAILSAIYFYKLL